GDGLSKGGSGLDGGQDALAASSAGSVVSRGVDVVHDVAKAGILKPEAVGGSGIVDSLLQLGRVKTNDHVVGDVPEVVRDHGGFERLEEVFLVDTVHALALEGVLELRVLSDDSYTENHGQDNGGSSVVTSPAVPRKRVEIGVGSGVVALAWCTEDTGDGAG